MVFGRFFVGTPGAPQKALGSWEAPGAPPLAGCPRRPRQGLP